MQEDSTELRKWLTPWTALLLVMCALGILLFPVPSITSMDNELGNLLHAPGFAILAAICFAGCRPLLPRRPIVLGVSVWLALATFGLLSEWLQGFVTRAPSRTDGLANIAGAAAGVLWMQSRLVRRPIARHGLLAAAFTLIVSASVEPTLAIYEYYLQSRAMPVLASFERPRELQHWAVNEARVARSADRASDGAFSMRLDLLPARWAGVSLRAPRDWSGYDELVFDAWLASTEGSIAPADQTINLIVRVADTANDWQEQDRFDKTVQLTADGKQTIRIRLSEIRAAPNLREMDLASIGRLQFFVVGPVKPRTIWLDAIRLE